MLVKAGFLFFAIGGLITLLWLVNLISLRYSLMYRDLYDIWFLRSYRLTRVVKGDFVTLIVGSQEPIGEWVMPLYNMCIRPVARKFPGQCF